MYRLSLNQLDVEPQAHENESDGDETNAEADAAMVALHHRVFSCLLICPRNFHSGLDILFNKVDLEAVNGDPCLGKGIACLSLVKAGFAHLHSGGLRCSERVVS